MCNPMLALVGLSAATTIYQTQQQGKLAAAQEASALKSDQIQQASVDEASRQAAQQATEQMSERAKQAMQDQARLQVMAGEHGLGGTSIAGMSQEIELNRATDVATLSSNLDARTRQATLDKQGISANTASRLNNIRQPDWVGAGLQIAGAGVQAWGAYQKQQDALKAATTKAS